MNVIRNTAILAAAVLAVSGLLVHAAPPTTAPATAPTSQTSDIEVREWVILIADAGQPNASGRAMFNATLPPFMTSRRENAPAGEDNRPTPMGVIRFSGEVDRETPVDVLLSLPNGSDVQATWPKAQVRPNRILWNNVYTDENAKAADLDAKHWMTPLRKSESSLIRSGGQAERFLMYDVALPYKTPLQLKADTGGRLRATNTGNAPLLDLMFYKKQKDKWTRATIASLAGRPDAAPAGGDKKAGATSKPDPNAAFDGPTTQATTEPAAGPRTAAKRAMLPTTRRAGVVVAPVTQPADVINEVTARSVAVTVVPDTVTGLPQPVVTERTTVTARLVGPTTTAAATRQASTMPSTGGGTAIAFARADGDDSAVLSPWKEALTAAGVLPGDVDTVVSVLKAHGLSERWMTAIYRLDPAEMDRLLPIEIVPTPRKITRVGLVIARGLDPSINDEIDRLVKQCGDADYTKRKAATAELISLGQPAKAKVEKAVNDKDPEISLRAEQILAAIEKKKG